MAPTGDGPPGEKPPERTEGYDPKLRGLKTRFQPGQSGNPGGAKRTLRWIRQFLDEAPPMDAVSLLLSRGVDVGAKDGTVPQSALHGLSRTRMELVAEAMFYTAIDRHHPQHVKAGQTLLAYRYGKPPQALEISGPGGKPIETVSPIEAMTSEQKIVRILELAKEAGAFDPTPAPDGSVEAGSKPPQ